MRQSPLHSCHFWHLPFLLRPLFLIAFLAACSNSGGNGVKSGVLPASQQILNLPLVGTMNIATLDPARDHGYNETLVMNMLYSGLVRTDRSLNVIPDQATWQLSADRKVYTFTLQPQITFSDGTPVTAQSYIYTWTRALLPATTSPAAFALLSPILGADEVHNGKTQKVTGVRALNASTLQVTLTKPAPYFLASLTNPLFFPLNQKLITRYGRDSWPQSRVEPGLGTGPFILKTWQPAVQLIFVPNPHYYGHKTALTTVVASFVNDPRVAFQLNGVGQTDLVWNITPEDQLSVRSSAGFTTTSLLQTDTLFIDPTKPPFDLLAVRQAFAQAIDKQALVHSVFDDALVPAATLFPPAMPEYQANQTFSYDAAQARSLLLSAYPDLSRFPSVTFSYPASQVSDQEATTLQSMWQKTLGIQVNVRAVEPDAYQQEMQRHVIQLGFYSLHADFPDRYAFFSPFASTSGTSDIPWHDISVERLISQAESQIEEQQRLTFYRQAETQVLTQAAIIPLDHQTFAALIPFWIRGVTLNGNGLYFGDWSGVSILRH